MLRVHLWITGLFFCIQLQCQPVKIMVSSKDNLQVYLKERAVFDIANTTHMALFDHLNYPLDFQHVSHKRSINMLGNNANTVVCGLNRLKTPDRQRKYIFSLPVNLFLGKRLYQHSDSKPISTNLLNNQKQLNSLVELFKQEQDSIIILQKGASQSDFIDQQLSKIDNKNKLYYDGFGKLELTFKMFLQKRADFFLAYPAGVFMRNQEFKYSFRSYGLAGADEAFSGHIMCNNTPQSKKFIKYVNDRLVKLYQNSLFLDNHLKYLPVNDHNTVINLIKKMIKRNSM